MDPLSLMLFDLRESRIVLAPDHRYRGIVDIGNGHFFARIVDRDRGNASIVEVDDVKLLLALARLTARGIAIGVLEPPPCVTRVGVHFDEASGIFGCFALDPGDRTPLDPLVAVEQTLCLATANLPRQPSWYSGETPEQALLYATSAFIAYRAAA